MTVFISGGCKNGKSGIAEDVTTRLAGDGPLYYIATMKAFDDEDRNRIKRHVRERDGKGFNTIEQPVNILEILKIPDAPEATFLLDSVTALMINELYHFPETICEEGSKEDTCKECREEAACKEDTCEESFDVNADKTAPIRVAAELTELCSRVKNIVFVSDYIYMEKDNYSEYTLEYMEALSYVDRALAKVCDAVCEVFYGNTVMYKGELPK